MKIDGCRHHQRPKQQRNASSIPIFRTLLTDCSTKKSLSFPIIISYKTNNKKGFSTISHSSAPLLRPSPSASFAFSSLIPFTELNWFQCSCAIVLCESWHDLVTSTVLTYHYLGQHSLSSTVSGHFIDGSDNGTHLAKCIDASDV